MKGKEGIKATLKEKISKLGLPAPDQLLPEIQRLNKNLEEVTPSLKRLDSFLEGTSAKEMIDNISHLLNL